MPLPVDVRADEVILDARSQGLEVRGDVRVAAPPFYLSSDHLHLRRSPRGVVVEGEGRVTFCPCLGSPVAVTFRGATVAPPSDLVLESPVLQVAGVPVAWAPAFWLRAPAKPGLLPPELAYRGGDGVFLGLGAHLPYRVGDDAGGLDVRGGAYVKGGFASDLTLKTPASSTRVHVDHLRTTGLAVDARGHVPDARGPATSWDVDVLRGRRGVGAATPLEEAARPFDRAAGEAAFRSVDGGGQWIAAVAVRTTAPRGGPLEDAGAAGPILTLRRSGAAGELLYDATIDGGTLGIGGGPSARDAVTFTRGEAGATWSRPLGPLGATLGTRAAGDAVGQGTEVYSRGLASARGELSLPLGRTFGEGPDPWQHRLDPRVGARALVAHEGPSPLPTPGRGVAVPVGGGAWVAEGALLQHAGRWGARQGLELLVAGGAAGTEALGAIRPMARARGAAELGSAAASVDYAAVIGQSAASGVTLGPGDMTVARARVGTAAGLHIGALAIGRRREDPVTARLLTDAATEPGASFLAAEGWSGGLRAQVPLARGVVLRGRADGDLGEGILTAAGGGLELRDGCGCLVLRGNASHRLGRPGLDVWISLDLTPPEALATR